MSVDIRTLGLKSIYVFKETHISTSHARHDIHEKLRQVVSPVIRDLESEGLINGFHHIIHKDIDLRLSCHDWQQYEPRIREVLRIHTISTDLKDWGPMPLESYGGETGVLLCYNNLEFNSRLSLALIELIHETDDESIQEAQHALCPHQWVHYLCNQFGYLNPDQILFELNDAFVWLQTLVTKNPGNRQIISFAADTLTKFKQAATQFENTLSQS